MNNSHWPLIKTQGQLNVDVNEYISMEKKNIMKKNGKKESNFQYSITTIFAEVPI